jgi:hypothetical protein
MSLQRLQMTVSPLPSSLREQVLGYARGLQAALPDISRDAGVAITAPVADQVVFIAGIKKLYTLCSSSFWAIDNAGVLLAREGSAEVRVGRTFYSRQATFHQELRTLLGDFEAVLVRQGIHDAVVTESYAELVRRLSREHRER